MNKFSDYSGYINSLKYNTNNKKFFDRIERKVYELDDKVNNPPPIGENIYNDLDYSNKPITITSNTNITYIEPKLDILPTSRRYLLEANPSIPNGKRKTIINNIHLSKDVILEIYCLNNNNQGGFFINEHEYNTYFFASKGEDLELIWNSSLNKWNVIKYNSLFRNI